MHVKYMHNTLTYSHNDSIAKHVARLTSSSSPVLSRSARIACIISLTAGASGSARHRKCWLLSSLKCLLCSMHDLSETESCLTKSRTAQKHMCVYVCVCVLCVTCQREWHYMHVWFVAKQIYKLKNCTDFGDSFVYMYMSCIMQAHVGNSPQRTAVVLNK